MTVGRLSGYEFIGPETSAAYQGSGKATDPSASEGTLVLAEGKTVFAVLAITAQPAADRSFLASFRLA